MRSDAARWTAWGVFLVLLTGVSWWFLGRDPDQGVLTRQVPVTVTGSHPEVRGGRAPIAGNRVDYTYAVGGRTYRAAGFVIAGAWRPGGLLAACVDPARPAVHILLVQSGVACGEARDRQGVRTAGPG